ncbi:ATP-grasp domain-containing protein [Mycena rebaudengoi]|nr:ATP-grasp domain-containing protein [Mycena rebaudengoi]
MSSLQNASGMQFTTQISLAGQAPLEAVWWINPASRTFQTLALSDLSADQKSRQFLNKCIRLAVSQPKTIKLVVPTTEGFLGRNNFFERRLLDCPFVEEVVGLLNPSEKAGPTKLVAPLPDSLLSIVASAAAGILLQPTSSTFDVEKLAVIEDDLNARLSFDWLLPSAPARKNVVLVEGYPHLQMGIGFIQAVKDLNVALVVIGPKGPKHWLEDPVNAEGFCQALIPVDLTFDGGLPSEDRRSPTAQAAEMLGLPAAPVRAHEISTDKYAMRQFQADNKASDFQLFQFAGVPDIARRLTTEADPVVLRYPAIVKPISGFASEGVAKVNSDTELLESVGKINTARHGDVVIVETYIDGPEFDANFVLCDGEILFFELTDDFPSPGDIDGAGADAPFFETSEFTPSALPAAERDIVRNSLHKTLLALGFTWGLYHIEGRLKDSAMEYRSDDSGLVDLRPRLQSRQFGQPSCFLLEINVRVPGVGCSFSTIHSYGVDFYAVPLLACIRDTERLRLIATPFHYPGRSDGSQYWCQVVFIQADRGGRYESEDACGELVRRCPELAGNIARGFSLYAKGAVVPDPATGLCVVLAYFLVYSRQSRKHAEGARGDGSG